MAMLNLHGTVLNVFKQPDFTDSEGKTTTGRNKVQLMCENTLKNGEKRVELVSLSTDRPDLFRPLSGHLVGVPVGVFAQKGGALIFYMVEDSVDDLGEGLDLAS